MKMNHMVTTTSDAVVWKKEKKKAEAYVTHMTRIVKHISSEKIQPLH